MVSYSGDLTCLPVGWLIEIMATFVWPLKGSLWLLQWSLCTQVVTSSFISPVRAHWAGSSILLSGRGVTTHTKPPHQCYYWSTKVFWDFFLSFQRLPWYNLEIFCSDESLDHYHTLIPSVCGDATDARLQKLKAPWYAWGLLAPWHVTFRWCSVFFFVFFSGGGGCLKRLYIGIVVRCDALTALKYGTLKLPQGQLPCHVDKSISHVIGRSVITFKRAPLNLKMQRITNVTV